MKILLVYRGPATQLALAYALQQRGYAVRCTTPTTIDSDLFAQFAADDGEDGMVIDGASRELAPDGSPVLAEPLFRQLTEYCQRQRWPLLLLSDSRVFPVGTKQRYRESDSAQPASPAGELLLQREQYLAEHLIRRVIVRTGPLIADSGLNLLTDLLQRFRRGGEVPVSSAPRFCPTPVADLARIIAAIVDQLDCAAQCWGIYHYHSSDAASGYEFAEVLLAAAAQYWDVGGSHVQLQATIDEPFGGVFPTLNCQLIRDTFGIQQLPWRKAIPQLLKTIYAGESS